MNLIAIETSGENCSVGLLSGGKQYQHSQLAPRKHAELVLPCVQQLLAQAELTKSDIDGIVFGNGPGAFTGVRIGMSIVQGLALGLAVPVMAVSTLHNMAVGAWLDGHRGRILVGNDARMNEVYWASFQLNDDSVRRLSEDAVSPPESLCGSEFDVYLGSAFGVFAELKEQVDGQKVDHQAMPNARNLLHLAALHFTEQAAPISQIKPNYVRSQVVQN